MLGYFVFTGIVLWLLQRFKVIKLLLETYRARFVKVEVLKQTSSKYDSVLDAFRGNFLDGREEGAQIAVTVDGALVLDAQGGKDEESIFKDITMIFSSTKVVEGLAIAMLVDRGVLEYDAPIAQYWPEFGDAFSKTITVAQLMKHEAGLEQFHKLITVAEAVEIFKDVGKIENYLLHSGVVKLDKDVANGERRTRYHAVTRGMFVDLLIYKVTGKRGRDFIHEEIVAKFGPEVDFDVGCPDDKQHRVRKCVPAQHLALTIFELFLHRVGFISRFVHPGPGASELDLEVYNRHYLDSNEIEMTETRIVNRKHHAFTSLIMISDIGLGAPYLANSPVFRSIPLLSSNGISNARSMALIAAELACGGGRLLSPQGLAKAMEGDETRFDEVLFQKVCYSNCGWSKNKFGQDWIGWAGSGGSLFVFSTKYRSSLAYIPTRLEQRSHKVNGIRMLKALTATFQTGSTE